MNEDKEYLGVISQSDLLHRMADIIAAHTPGGIIELELGRRDYALSEIARIVEDSDAKILSLYVMENNANNSLHVSIKVNRSDLRPVLQGFDRYGYKVNASFSDQDYDDEEATKNYDSLMMFLNV